MADARPEAQTSSTGAGMSSGSIAAAAAAERGSLRVGSLRRSFQEKVGGLREQCQVELEAARYAWARLQEGASVERHRAREEGVELVARVRGTEARPERGEVHISGGG